MESFLAKLNDALRRFAILWRGRIQRPSSNFASHCWWLASSTDFSASPEPSKKPGPFRGGAIVVFFQPP